MPGSNSSARDGAAARAEPLHLTVHSMPAASLHGDDRRTRAGRWKMLAVLAVCASPVVASYFTYFVVRPEGRTNYGELVAPAREMPAALPLTDLDGRAVDPASLKGQWLLVSVAPAACDAACERRLYTQRQLREMTGRERDRIDKLWLVTDEAPVRPALREALAAAPATQVLRVPAAELARWLQPAEGHALADHLYVVDPRGGWMMRAPAELDPMRFKRDLEKLLRASSSWDQPGR
jgi:hypothetical protein